MKWQDLDDRDKIQLYAGDIPLGHPQSRTHIGLSLDNENQNHIKHDVTRPFLLPGGSVYSFQSEDVFEHIEYEKMPAVLNEIYRILRPGGLCRISVPDYRCDVLYNRSIKTRTGELVFDPGGGGELVVNSETNIFSVVSGGHVWFPTYENVKDIIEKTRFGSEGKYEFLHCHYSGATELKEIDYFLGYISRTPDHDERVKNPRRPMSIVVDLYTEKK